ncbi:MAG: aminopeptidase N [Bdellovibrionales bacterium]|nr:aminopeptidase N [Bdellovibrionales bacterium]
MSQPKVIYLKDYEPPKYWIKKVDLVFDIYEGRTSVTATSQVERNESTLDGENLFLSGEEMKLLSLKVNGHSHPYELVEGGLLILSPPSQFELEVHNEIVPETNKALEGLYKTASGFYCTQCEAEGFRRITYFIDRPDNMALYTTTIRADKAKYPILLSNGNCVEQVECEGGRHTATWEDPFPKPSYLFALVAGNLEEVADKYKTSSGRDVSLHIYTDPGRKNRTPWAMDCLKASMKWDEEKYGLEYDLDRYMIVAVDDFNMGAMENKGLNIFNSRCVLADEASATDRDFYRIEGIIGHEYFHNWTGNRVTCRDWFQLSLKEGLTVFRDQQFSADLNSFTVQRIDDVTDLRSDQFLEDSGPNAHPVRPASAISVDNFYTATVYRKGAEVIRMYHTLLGEEGFRKGIDKYFELYDGQAVTTEDFLNAMSLASGKDLSQFQKWYDQSGTPEIKGSGQWNEADGEFVLSLTQSCPPTPGQPEKKPFLIPIRLGFLSAQGKALDFVVQGGSAAVKEAVIELKESSQEYVFKFSEEPIPSLLRDFSAPVRLSYPYSDADLLTIMGHDPNLFNRWDAGQTLLKAYLLKSIEAKDPENVTFPEAYLHSLKKNLIEWKQDPAFTATILDLPTRSYLEQFVDEIHPDIIELTIRRAKKVIATSLKEELRKAFLDADPIKLPVRSKQAIAHRELRDRCLSYLSQINDVESLKWIEDLYRTTNNMTEKMTALSAVNRMATPLRGELLDDFYQVWKKDTVVFNKWLGVCASEDGDNCFQWIQGLKDEPHFDFLNPNNVYTSYLTFVYSTIRFHDLSGDAYAYIADRVLELDKHNPQVAASVLEGFSQWKRYEPIRRQLQKKELEKIFHSAGLSKNCFEIVSRALKGSS